MNYDEAIALAKKNPGSAVIRNQEGSFQVKFHSGEIIDNDEQDSGRTLSDLISENDRLKSELIILKNKIDEVNTKLEISERAVISKIQEVNELKTKLQVLKNIEATLSEKEKEIKDLNEHIDNLSMKTESILFELDDLKHIVSNVNPETVADIRREREKEKAINIVLEKLENLSRFSLDDLRQLKETAITLGLQQSKIDEIGDYIILKEKAMAQLSPSKVSVGTTKTPETVNPFTKGSDPVPGCTY